jgi:hypothetical protein
MFDTIVQSEKCFVNPIIRLDILIGNLIEDNRTLSHLLFEKTKEITAVSVVLYTVCDKKSCSCIYMNFSFDFLGLDNVHF